MYHYMYNSMKMIEQSAQSSFQIQLLDQTIHIPEEFRIAVQLEKSLVGSSELILPQQPQQIVSQHFQLEVLLSAEVGQNGNPVVKLEGIGVGSIINQKHILHLPPQNPQVLDEVSLARQVAVLSVESMMDQLSLGVQVVQYLVGVATVAGCENDDFELALEKVENLKCPGSDVDPSFCRLPCRKFNVYFDVVRHRSTLVAVDEGLVQIEDHCSQPLTAFLNLQLQHLVLDLCFRGHFALLKVFQNLQT